MSQSVADTQSSQKLELAPFVLLLLQIVAHLSIIPMVIYADLYHWAIALAVYFLTGCFGMSVTYHRLLSHRSWNANKFIEYAGTLFGTIGLTGSSLAWTAIHVQHHNHTDDELDPHSPMQKGFLRSHFLSMFEKPNLHFVKHLSKDPFHRFCHRYYLLIQLLYCSILLAIDPFLIISAYLFPAAVLWNTGSSINSFCHAWGYKNFDLRNSAKNNWIFGILTFGEGWHNNHHRYPKRWNFQVKTFELDIGALLIRLIRSKNRIEAADEIK